MVNGIINNITAMENAACCDFTKENSIYYKADAII